MLLAALVSSIPYVSYRIQLMAYVAGDNRSRALTIAFAGLLLAIAIASLLHDNSRSQSFMNPVLPIMLMVLVLVSIICLWSRLSCNCMYFSIHGNPTSFGVRRTGRFQPRPGLNIPGGLEFF